MTTLDAADYTFETTELGHGSITQLLGVITTRMMRLYLDLQRDGDPPCYYFGDLFDTAMRQIQTVDIGDTFDIGIRCYGVDTKLDFLTHRPTHEYLELLTLKRNSEHEWTLYKQRPL